MYVYYLSVFTVIEIKAEKNINTYAFILNDNEPTVFTEIIHF